MTYAPPVREHPVHPARRAAHRHPGQRAGFRGAFLRRRRAGPHRSRPLLRRGAGAAERPRRQGRLRALGRRLGDHPAGVQGRLGPAHRRRLDGPQLPLRLRRPGAALGPGAGLQRDELFGQHGVFHVPGPHPRRLFGHPRRRLGGAERALSPQARQRRVDRDHEPHRAAVRHRSWPHPHQGRRRRRRLLPHHRREDLDQRRRA